MHKNFKDKEDIENIEDLNDKNKFNNDKKNLYDLQDEGQYKSFEDEDNEEEVINPSMKKFRRIIGVLLLISLVWFLIFGNKFGNTNYKDNLKSGKIEDVNVGDMITKEAVKLEPKDFSIEVTNGAGKIELSIWNFADKEDGDYVQVFVDGVPQTEPFSIRHKAVKVGVPDKAIIQVKGVRDGSNNGITYGLFFNKTGETYLNTVPLNVTNTYTIKTLP